MQLSNPQRHAAPRPSAEHLLADFQRVRKENTPLPDVVMETLNKTLGPGVAEIAMEMPLGKALIRLSHAVQKDTDTKPGKLDYHNIAHFREAVMSVGHLSALEFEGQAASPHLVMLAMTAMVGHDFKHDGTSNTPNKSLEAMAWDACKPHLQDLPSEDMNALESIILATDPTKLNDHRARYASAQMPPGTIERLRLLACEADLTPSLLPAHGVAMGKMLANEMTSSGVANLETLGKTIGSWESRMGFLRYATPISLAAEKFGLAHMHSVQLQAFSALTETLGTASDKDTAKYLDGLDNSSASGQASQVYMAAIMQVDGALGQSVCQAMNIPEPAPLQPNLSFGM